jgi:hypothetical protein
MKIKPHLFAKIVLGVNLCLSLSLQVTGQAVPPVELTQKLPGVTVVDQVAARLGTGTGVRHAVLGVDQDDLVRVYDWSVGRRKPPSNVEITEYLPWQRITRSGALALSPLLPRNEVAIAAFRFTRTPLTRHHVIFTYGFEKWETVAPSQRLSYNLYVISEDRQKRTARVTYKEEQVNISLEDLVVRDLSGDGSVEIIDVGREAEIATATVRVLDTSGNVAQVQQIDASYIYVLGPRWNAVEVSLSLEDKGEPRNTHRSLCWSAEKKQFADCGRNPPKSTAPAASRDSPRPSAQPSTR